MLGSSLCISVSFWILALDFFIALTTLQRFQLLQLDRVHVCMCGGRVVLSNFLFVFSSCFCLISKSCLTLLWQHGLKPARFLCPRNFPGKNTGAGCHFLLQGIFLIQGLNPHLLHYSQILYHWTTWDYLQQRADPNYLDHLVYYVKK